MVSVAVLFVFLVGASNAIVPTREPEKAVPGKSFGAGKGLGTTSSTNEPVKVAPEPERKFMSKSKEVVNPAVSGESPAEGSGIAKVGTRAYSEVLDSFDLGYPSLDDCEWNGRYIYVVQGWSSVDSSDIIVFDPENGSIADQWTLPFMGAAYGIAFVNNSMYVSDCSNGLIRKINPVSHALIASFSAPGGSNVRGMTSDGTNLYIGVGIANYIYLTDTLGNVLNSWDISSFCVFSLGLAYAPRDSTIWLVDANAVPAQIIKADLSGASAVLLDAFRAPNQNTASGIAFDNSDLWFNAFDGTKLYRIDGGYSRSRIALFQDYEPWGHRSVKDILYENGIPFKVFGSSDIGNADLSIYTKAIIAGQQDRAMGDTIAAYKSWWENWISNGGVLQISGATYWSDSWEGLTLPGDFSCISSDATSFDTLNIVSSWHPLVNEPYAVNGVDLSDWHYSTHGYLVGITGHYAVIEDTLSRPVLAIKRLGDGGIIATMQPLEYAWGNGLCPILENVIKYWQYGVSKNVLYAMADYDQTWMRDALMARDSLIGNVDYMDIRYYSPLMEDLNMYDVVLLRTNYPCLDNIAMGDTLATYVVDQGGKVVLTVACWYGSTYGLSGAIMDPDYNPFSTPSGGNHYNWASLGWYDATHPMMDGVTTFSEYYRDYLQVNPGADTVAKYDDGEYLLGFKAQGSGGLVVGFNAYPKDTFQLSWTGQMVKLLSNIIDWSTAYSGIEDVTEGEKGFKILEISNPILTGKEWLTLSIGSPDKVEFRIINIVGMVVSSTSVDYTTPGIKKIDFDVLKLPSGAYFLSLKTKKGNAIKKAMIIR
jgi:hypothetical protein